MNCYLAFSVQGEDATAVAQLVPYLFFALETYYDKSVLIWLYKMIGMFFRKVDRIQMWWEAYNQPQRFPHGIQPGILSNHVTIHTPRDINLDTNIYHYGTPPLVDIALWSYNSSHQWVTHCVSLWRIHRRPWLQLNMDTPEKNPANSTANSPRVIASATTNLKQSHTCCVWDVFLSLCVRLICRMLPYFLSS